MLKKEERGRLKRMTEICKLANMYGAKVYMLGGNGLKICLPKGSSMMAEEFLESARKLDGNIICSLTGTI